MAGNSNASLKEAEHSLNLQRRSSIQDENSDFGEFENSLSENKNTKRKTETDMRIFLSYLVSMNELRDAEVVPPMELDRYLTTFFSVIKKHDGNDYEAASLRGMLCSIERYLRSRNYPTSLTRDAAFLSTRNMLKEKQKLLREMSKTVKKTKHEVLTSTALERLKHLYNAKEFGPYSPMAVINSLCFAFVVHLRIRKAIDHKQLLWGDIALKRDNSKEYLCYEPLPGYDHLRQKLDGISNLRLYAQEPENVTWDAVALYKLYTRKRPSQVMTPESQFYLGIAVITHMGSQQQWYKTSTMGVNKLNDLVRMVRDITGSLSNGSVDVTRAYTVGSNPTHDDLDDGEEPIIINEETSLRVDTDVHSRLLPIYVHNEREMNAPRTDAAYNDDETESSKTNSNDNSTDDTDRERMSHDCSSKADEVYTLESRNTDNKSRSIYAGGSQFHSDIEMLTVDGAKNKIRETVKHLDTAVRKEVVTWMNGLTVNADSSELQERAERRRKYNLSFELDHSDLLHLETTDVTAVLTAKIQVLRDDTQGDIIQMVETDNDAGATQTASYRDDIDEPRNGSASPMKSNQSHAMTPTQEAEAEAQSTFTDESISTPHIKRRSSETVTTNSKFQKTEFNGINPRVNNDEIHNGNQHQAGLNTLDQTTDITTRPAMTYSMDKINIPPLAVYPHEMPKEYTHMYPPWAVDPRFAMFMRHGLMTRYQDIGYMNAHESTE